MCFVYISEQTAITSLYSINWLVFIIETECVYCAVRTESFISNSGQYFYDYVNSCEKERFNKFKGVGRNPLGIFLNHCSDIWVCTVASIFRVTGRIFITHWAVEATK